MTKELESIRLVAAPRTEIGSSRVNRLRKQGWLPCVIYDTQGNARMLQTNRHTFEMLVRHQGSQNLILDLEIEGDGARKVLLKEIQRDHLRDSATHVDFMEISMTKKLKVSVEIRLQGEPSGVTQQGGILEHLLRTIEVECLPTDIVQEFTLDISAMNVGERLFVRDLKLGPNFSLLTDGDIAVATVQLPHVEEEVKPEAEAGAAAAAGPEVIGKATEEGAEGDAAAGKEGKGAEAKGKEKGKESAEAKKKPAEGKEKARTK